MSYRALVAAAVVVLTMSPTFAQEKKPLSREQLAWDDVRYLMTALEAYSTDHDDVYAPADGPREGNVAELDEQLKWYYANTYPKKAAPPHSDPWGRPYRFVISRSGKDYALYTLGAAGKLEPAPAALLERVRNDELTDADRKNLATSKNLVAAAGHLAFAPPEVADTLAER
jgi:hypothetical protein